MRIITLFLLFICLAINVSAQTRQQAIAELEQLKERGKSLDEVILQIDKKDSEDAAGAEVFRILPREKYDVGLVSTRGGGAYYSFSNKSHSYNDIPQIELQRGNLSVGFAGADYGFLTDLGEIPLSEINKESKGVSFLLAHQPPNQLAKARIEQEKGRGFENDGVIYKDALPAAVGHSYVLRAVSFNKADVLVAFKIHREDDDGSLIIFWKLLENFEKPQLIRNEQASSTSNAGIVSAAVSESLAAKIEEALRKRGFKNVKVDVSTVPMTLRGTVPKGKLAEVVYLVQENNGGKPVRNEMTEK